MEAIVYEEFGGPEVLRHTTGVAVPEPGPGEVRVRVAAVGLNPVDWKRRYGWVEEYYPTTFPAVPGLEFAGTVDGLGEGVTGLAVGDEVLGWTKTGAYAEYAIAGIVAPKPAGLSWEAAASLPVAGETAQRVLDLIGVRQGETLFLHGAAGVVGSVGVQLAVAAGITVVGSASESNHAYLRELGAIPVAYGEGLADRVRARPPTASTRSSTRPATGCCPSRSSSWAGRRRRRSGSRRSPTSTRRSTGSSSRETSATPTPYGPVSRPTRARRRTAPSRSGRPTRSR